MKTASKGAVARHAATADVIIALTALSEMPVPDLRKEWRRLYRTQSPPKCGRHLLELGVAWKLQERVHGGLSSAMKRQLANATAAMDQVGDLTKARIASLKPGTKLLREWHGEIHTVLVLDDGFQWRGERWRSLSAIARKISGTRWSGPRFFGLHPKTKAAGEVRSGTAPKTIDGA